MPRINLSIDDDLFTAMQNAANQSGCTVNVLVVSILETLYKQTPFNYSSALATLEEEAKSQPYNQDFTLVDLPSFKEISVAKAENANLKPSVVRARLGRMFNTRIKEGKVGNVKRSVDGQGNLKFISRTAVYANVRNSNSSDAD
ncbi:MAG: hypothetical protein IKK51_02860 [Oscillospiraceae bacterium]|nr:hypothetical protein [Oscillospiraceae bacterium]MBR4100803.1 hypothetical protein [Oscillospiraceae bacterium]